MADMLCAPEDLASLLESDLDEYKAIMLVECATAVVQASTGNPPQRIVEVTDDGVALMGSPAAWLDLPQRPVTAVTAVELDGEELAADGWKLFGSRLWRSAGWASTFGEPSEVVVTYDHGYPAGHQALQLARNACLSLLRGVYGNPEGATRVSIDDYTEAFDKMSAQMDASEFLQKALRRQYGQGAGLVRVA